MHQVELVLFLEPALRGSVPDHQVNHFPGQDFRNKISSS